MGKTKIEWADVTWNPIIGCSKCSPGCDNCYAERMAERLAAMGTRGYADVVEDGGWNGKVRYIATKEPFAKLKPSRIFVGSMGDIFHESLHPTHLVYLFKVFARNPHHTFMLLTKRDPSGKMNVVSECLKGYRIDAPLPNVWLGVTVENQEQADKRIPWLLSIPAAKRFVSVEPMLGPVVLPDMCDHGACNDWGNKGCDHSFCESRQLHWVICGGENGPGARPVHPDWVLGLRDRCKKHSVPFFFKGWGEWGVGEMPWYAHDVKPLKKNERWMNLEGGHGFHGDSVYRMQRVGKHRSGRLLDGVEYSEFPGEVGA